MKTIDRLKQALLDLSPQAVSQASMEELEVLEYILNTKHSLVKHNKDIRLQASHKHHK